MAVVEGQRRLVRVTGLGGLVATFGAAAALLGSPRGLTLGSPALFSTCMLRPVLSQATVGVLLRNASVSRLREVDLAALSAPCGNARIWPQNGSRWSGEVQGTPSSQARMEKCCVCDILAVVEEPRRLVRVTGFGGLAAPFGAAAALLGSPRGLTSGSPALFPSYMLRPVLSQATVAVRL